MFDLHSGQHLKTVKGVETPHSIFYMPDRNRLLVTDSGTGMSKVLNATTYEVVGSVKLVPGADSIGYDAPRKRLYVVTGGKDVNMAESYLAEIDPRTGEQFSVTSKFDANPAMSEAMAVEPGSQATACHINVTDKNYPGSSRQRRTRTQNVVQHNGPSAKAQQNAPRWLSTSPTTASLSSLLASPASCWCWTPQPGATIASFTAPERTDEVVYDSANRRVYIAGGEGYIGVIQQQDPNHYTELARIPSAKGAKTAILTFRHYIGSYVAVSPGENQTGAAVIWFDVLPNGGLALSERAPHTG